MHGHTYVKLFFSEQLLTKIASDLPDVTSKFYTASIFEMGHAVAQLIEALRYRLEGREFDFRWCHCNVVLT